MAVCYFEVVDSQGVVNQPLGKGPINIIDDADPVRLARGILDEYSSGGAGWTCRVWITGGIQGPLGEPDAVVTA